MVVAIVIRTAVTRFFFITELLGQPDTRDYDIDQLDSNKRDDDAAYSVNQQVAAEQRGGAHWTVFHSTQRQRYPGHDDQRIEDNGRQHSKLRSFQARTSHST